MRKDLEGKIIDTRAPPQFAGVLCCNYLRVFHVYLSALPPTQFVGVLKAPHACSSRWPSLLVEAGVRFNVSHCCAARCLASDA
jgi:hypothetical protein